MESIKRSKSVFGYVHLLYYKCHKINRNHGGSYRDCSYWIKNKKAAINPNIKKHNKCFQCTVTFTLNPEEIKKDVQRITKVKRFVNKYNWKGINFSSEKNVWKKFEKNNVTIAFNVFVSKNKKYVLLMFQYINQIMKNKWFF